MKVKKILTFAFAAVLMTSMTSCGNEDGPGGDGGGNGGGTEHTEYFGVNMSGAEFGGVFQGEGTAYDSFPVSLGAYPKRNEWPAYHYGVGQDERICASSRGLEHESLARYAQLRSLLRLFQWCEL